MTDIHSDTRASVRLTSRPLGPCKHARPLPWHSEPADYIISTRHKMPATPSTACTTSGVAEKKCRCQILVEPALMSLERNCAGLKWRVIRGHDGKKKGDSRFLQSITDHLTNTARTCRSGRQVADDSNANRPSKRDRLSMLPTS